MCDQCGCNHHGHTHGPDSLEHSHGYGRIPTQEITLERRILTENDERARANRRLLEERKVVAINLISSPGSGKTLLLEKTLERLNGKICCAVIAGDQVTGNDSRRLEGKGAHVRQIETASVCHLDAEMVGRLLPEMTGGGVRLLFIENVGNLVCPAAFDLGENVKVALLSVTEGEDKPIKYPSLFSQAPVTILTKLDLVPHLDWNIDLCRSHLRRINPGVLLLELSAGTGEGMDAWIRYLLELVE